MDIVEDLRQKPSGRGRTAFARLGFAFYGGYFLLPSSFSGSQLPLP